MSTRRNVACIIDDEVDLCLLIKVYFLRKNYEVRISHTCKEVVNALEEGIIPGIVIFDKSVCADPGKVIKTIRKLNPDARIHVSGPGMPKYHLKSKAG